MLSKITDRVSITLLIIIAIVLCLDLFLHRGTPTTFDAPTHITNLAMINTGLLEGEFPVTWNNTFSNYGLPMPLIIQQSPAYLGGILLFAVGDPVLAYHLVILIFTIGGSLAMYMWLRCYAVPYQALVATALYSVAPYKLVNIYARGALPEYAAAMFLPLIAFALHQLIQRQRAFAVPLLGLSIGFLLLTHPMVAIVGSPFLSIYALTLVALNRHHFRAIFTSILAVIFGIGLAAYYLLPLQSEIKYFLYGTYPSNLKPDEFLTVQSIWTFDWPYWSDIPTRGYTLRVGIPEQFILAFFLVITLLHIRSYTRTLHQPAQILSIFCVLISSIYIFLLTPLSLFLYKFSPTLANIQYPTRMLTGLMTIIPLIIIILMQRSRKITLLLTGLIIFTLAVRLPDAHGKNYLDQPRTEYYSSVKNMHGNFLNTIWMDAPEKYPLRSTQAEIIGGSGNLTILSVQNSLRHYSLQADSSVQLIDYTFFFPGWKVYANGVEIPIEFQDIAHRGIITYRLDPGKYDITVKFIPTRVRKYGLLFSGVSLGALAVLSVINFYLRKSHLHTISRKKVVT